MRVREWWVLVLSVGWSSAQSFVSYEVSGFNRYCGLKCRYFSINFSSCWCVMFLLEGGWCILGPDNGPISDPITVCSVLTLSHPMCLFLACIASSQAHQAEVRWSPSFRNEMTSETPHTIQDIGQHCYTINWGVLGFKLLLEKVPTDGQT